jgi:prevent-host-death family protein
MDKTPPETMAISKFKATCLAVLERVRRTGEPILITRFGEPVAEVVPPRKEPIAEEWLGSMAARGRIVGDVISPAAEPSEWEALGPETPS